MSGAGKTIRWSAAAAVVGVAVGRYRCVAGAALRARSAPAPQAARRTAQSRRRCAERRQLARKITLCGVRSGARAQVTACSHARLVVIGCLGLPNWLFRAEVRQVRRAWWGRCGRLRGSIAGWS
jgi:hypothetical protein